MKRRVNETKFQIQWGDTDRAGIVYYPNYYKWFDLAGHNFFRSIEMSPKYLEEEKKIIIPLLEAKCSFEKPLYYDDEVIVYTHVEELKTKTIQFHHEVYCGEKGLDMDMKFAPGLPSRVTGLRRFPFQKI